MRYVLYLELTIAFLILIVHLEDTFLIQRYVRPSQVIHSLLGTQIRQQ